jgi:hypothetical protein
MKPITWMIAGCLASWAAISAAAGPAVNPELLWGMAGPLVSAVATWAVIERAQASAPERLTNVMIAAFGVKVVLFAAYVIVLLAGLGLRPLPFVAGFSAYYVVLHAAEALCLQRLLARRAHSS